jgi:hypothetical protein
VFSVCLLNPLGFWIISVLLRSFVNLLETVTSLCDNGTPPGPVWGYKYFRTA